MKNNKLFEKLKYNEDTLKAIEEAKKVSKDFNVKTFKNIKQLMEDLEN